MSRCGHQLCNFRKKMFYNLLRSIIYICICVILKVKLICYVSYPSVINFFLSFLKQMHIHVYITGFEYIPSSKRNAKTFHFFNWLKIKYVEFKKYILYVKLTYFRCGFIYVIFGAVQFLNVLIFTLLCVSF